MEDESEIKREAEIKRKCWSALALIKDLNNPQEVLRWARIHHVSVKDVMKYAEDFPKK